MTASATLAIELRNINKTFGAVRANHDVNLQVRKGSIHGIVGENGAGKSTLMSILYGFYEADSGSILCAGKPVRIRSSADAIAHGIGMVHQHFMLVDTFSVLENVMLGAEQGALLRTGKRKARASLEQLEREYDLRVDLDAVVGDLPVGQQQRVEILKALYRGAEILILDEPTGVLTPQEADQLFRILRALQAQGVTILLITHKLREIMDVTDQVSVMRHYFAHLALQAFLSVLHPVVFEGAEPLVVDKFEVEDRVPPSVFFEHAQVGGELHVERFLLTERDGSAQGGGPGECGCGGQAGFDEGSSVHMCRAY